VPSAGVDTLALLDEVGSPATVASAGARFFGFVTGGALPAAVAAGWLASAWDQNGAMRVMSPAASAIEATARRWLVEILGLPSETHVSFVTGTTTADMTALVAARRAVLQRHGWDVETRGLAGAPSIQVIVGQEVHTSMYRALSVIGLGRDQIHHVPADDQGRIRADALPPIGGPTIVCLQAGNVNTGAVDPVGDICRRIEGTGAWVHVDGAFGLWASVSSRHRQLADGFAEADSWVSDGHKWLNVPYDCGLAFVRRVEPLREALAMSAHYLVQDHLADPMNTTLEASRRARGIEVWAVLRSLGRQGVEALIDQSCRLARRFADGLRDAGYDVLNEISLNQVLVAFGDADRTNRVIRELQAEGTCWCGGTSWRGRTAMRISVSGWATTDADVDRSLAAMIRLAGHARR
jgi:glutamate/tyrosine decarboxylase-like PLP-dependent enzyme